MPFKSLGYGPSRGRDPSLTSAWSTLTDSDEERVATWGTDTTQRTNSTRRTNSTQFTQETADTVYSDDDDVPKGFHSCDINGCKLAEVSKVVQCCKCEKKTDEFLYGHLPCETCDHDFCESCSNDEVHVCCKCKEVTSIMNGHCICCDHSQCADCLHIQQEVEEEGLGFDELGRPEWVVRDLEELDVREWLKTNQNAYGFPLQPIKDVIRYWRTHKSLDKLARGEGVCDAATFSKATIDQKASWAAQAFVHRPKDVRLIFTKKGFTYRTASPANKVPAGIHVFNGVMKNKFPMLKPAPDIGIDNFFWFNYKTDTLVIEYNFCGSRPIDLSKYLHEMMTLLTKLRKHYRDHPDRPLRQLELPYCPHLDHFCDFLDYLRPIRSLKLVTLKVHDHYSGAYTDSAKLQEIYFLELDKMEEDARLGGLEKSAVGEDQEIVPYPFTVEVFDARREFSIGEDNWAMGVEDSGTVSENVYRTGDQVVDDAEGFFFGHKNDSDSRDIESEDEDESKHGGDIEDSVEEVVAVMKQVRLGEKGDTILADEEVKSQALEEEANDDVDKLSVGLGDVSLDKQ